MDLADIRNHKHAWIAAEEACMESYHVSRHSPDAKRRAERAARDAVDAAKRGDCAAAREARERVCALWTEATS